MRLITDIPQLAFSSELADIHLADVEDILLFSIVIGDELIFEEKLIADTSREVFIGELDKILEPYFLMSPILDIEFSFSEGNSLEKIKSKVIYSRAKLEASIRYFCHQKFLTLLMGDKEVFLNDLEYLHVYPMKREQYSIEAFYKNKESGEYESAKIVGDWLDVGELHSIEVSPSLFYNSGKELTKYIVSCGVRNITYLIREDLQHVPQLLFTNNFGLVETFSAKGILLLEDKYENQFGSVRGNYKKFAIDLVREFTASTGVMSQEVANWVASDLFQSLDVFEIKFRNIVSHKVTITEQNIKRNTEDTELPVYDFKYRREERNQQVYAMNKYLYSVFSKQFDKTFRGEKNNTY